MFTKNCDKFGASQNVSPILSPYWSQNSVNHQICHQMFHQICHQIPWGSYMQCLPQYIEPDMLPGQYLQWDGILTQAADSACAPPCGRHVGFMWDAMCCRHQPNLPAVNSVCLRALHQILCLACAHTPASFTEVFTSGIQVWCWSASGHCNQI